MARFYTCRNAGKAPTNDHSTSNPISALFYASTSAPTQIPVLFQAPAFTSTLISAPGLLRKYIDKLL